MDDQKIINIRAAQRGVCTKQIKKVTEMLSNDNIQEPALKSIDAQLREKATILRELDLKILDNCDSDQISNEISVASDVSESISLCLYEIEHALQIKSSERARVASEQAASE